DREVIGAITQRATRPGGDRARGRTARTATVCGCALAVRLVAWLRSAIGRGGQPQALRDDSIGALALGNAEHGSGSEAPVYDGRYEQRQLASAGSGQAVAGVDHGDLTGVALASLQPARAQLLEPLRHALALGPRLHLGVLGRD